MLAGAAGKRLKQLSDELTFAVHNLVMVDLSDCSSRYKACKQNLRAAQLFPLWDCSYKIFKPVCMDKQLQDWPSSWQLHLPSPPCIKNEGMQVEQGRDLPSHHPHFPKLLNVKAEKYSIMRQLSTRRAGVVQGVSWSNGAVTQTQIILENLRQMSRTRRRWLCGRGKAGRCEQRGSLLVSGGGV